MAKADLTKKSEKDLIKELDQLKKDTRDLRFGIAGSKTRDVNVFKKNRQDIARIMTELNKRNNTK